MSKNMPEIAGKIWAVIKKNKFVMIVLVIGLVLILLPTGSRGKETETTAVETSDVSFSLSGQEGAHLSGTFTDQGGRKGDRRIDAQKRYGTDTGHR